MLSLLTAELCVRREEIFTMLDSTVVTDSEHNYLMQIPNTIPTGQSVEILKIQHEGIHGIHAHSPDESEVYFELMSYPQLLNHEEAVAGQRASLSSRSSDATMTAAKQSKVHTFGATEFHFEGALQGRWKVRRFIFLDSAIRTYKVIYDPRSAVNEYILDSLRLDTGYLQHYT